jgi:hypothetical protein
LVGAGHQLGFDLTLERLGLLLALKAWPERLAFAAAFGFIPADVPARALGAELLDLLALLVDPRIG